MRVLYPGRSISPYDIDIFKEVSKRFPKDRVKLDYDVLHEPCIFYRHRGPFQLAYKLSKDGRYTRNLWYYVVQAGKAINEFIRQREEEYRRSMIKDAKERVAAEDFKIAQERFQKQGFRDNLPTE